MLTRGKSEAFLQYIIKTNEVKQGGLGKEKSRPSMTTSQELTASKDDLKP